MKYLKNYLTIFILLLTLSNSFAQGPGDCLDPDDCTSGPQPPDTGAPGTTDNVPIDEYQGLLLITALTAGLYYAKKKNLILKNK